MILHLFEGVTLALPAILTPGPYAAFLLAETLRHGARRTFPAAFAPLITDGFIIALVMWVLSSVPPLGLELLRLAGGLLLLWIAWGLARAIRSGPPDPEVESRSLPLRSSSLLRAVAMNLLNPNPYIFWAVVAGPLLLRAWSADPADGIALLVGFYTTFVGGLLAMILAFAGVGAVAPGVRTGLSALAALALSGFGCFQLVSAGLALGRLWP